MEGTATTGRFGLPYSAAVSRPRGDSDGWHRLGPTCCSCVLNIPSYQFIGVRLLKRSPRNGVKSSGGYARRDTMGPANGGGEKASGSEGPGVSLDIEVLRGLCLEGRLQEALDRVEQLQQQGVRPSIKMYDCLLQGCTRLKRASDGRSVHLHLIKSGYQSNVFLNKSLVRMYAECGCLCDARQVFDGLSERDVFSWNVIIQGNADHGRGEEAVSLYDDMVSAGVEPNECTFLGVLKACASLEELERGRCIWGDISRCGLDAHVAVASSSIQLFARCGGMDDARLVFESMSAPTLLGWNLMIAGYTENGQDAAALDLLEEMRLKMVLPDAFTYSSVITACGRLGAMERGRQIHAEVVDRGFGCNVHVASSLVDMYGKCSSIEDAQTVFEQVKERDVVAWTAMISGYCQNEHGVQALTLFWQMQQKGVRPDKVALVTGLKACAILDAVDQGRQIHAEVNRREYEIDTYLGTSLIEMYASCGCVDDAVLVFDKMKQRDVAVWNAMIAAHVQHKRNDEAVWLYRCMVQERTAPDQVTMVSTLTACAHLAALGAGREVHDEVRRRGWETDMFVASALVDMYSKCGSMTEARAAFERLGSRDVVAWGALIVGYADQEEGREAFDALKQMQEESIKPDVGIFVCILKLCARLKDVQQGRQTHEEFRKSRLEPTSELEHALVHMYLNCGHVKHALAVFAKMRYKRQSCYTALLASCMEQPDDKSKALDLAGEMQDRGLEMDKPTLIALLNLCGELGDVKKGRKLLAYMSKMGLEEDRSVTNAAITMSAAYGSVEEARQLLERTGTRDAGAWGEVLEGYVRIGECEEALVVMDRMCRQGIEVETWRVSEMLELSAGWGDQVAGNRLISQLQLMLHPG